MSRGLVAQSCTLPRWAHETATAGPRTVPPAWPKPLRRGEGPVRSTIAGEKAQECSGHLDRAACCGRGPPALRWEYQDAPSPDPVRPLAFPDTKA